MVVDKPKGPRSVALVGPYSSGKTTLLEAILHICNETDRKGSVTAGTSCGDSSKEARERQMGVEVNAAHAQYLGDEFTILDCPGSIEFFQETENALLGVDAAVVVCEPESERALTLSPLLKSLQERGLPTFIFVNKMDKAYGSVQDLFNSLQAVSDRALVLRQVPIFRENIITGYVDLASERAYVYKEGEASRIIDLPPEMAEEEGNSRFEMLEKLADFDDHLMEELLEDIEPEREEIYSLLQNDLREGLVTPVFLGSAENENGVRRLLKALRHEVPEASVAAARAGYGDESDAAVAQIIKTYMSAQGGKLSLARIWSGKINDGDSFAVGRIGGLFRLQGGKYDKLESAGAGEIVAFGRLEAAQTGDILLADKTISLLPDAVLEPVYSIALVPENRDDEVKLSSVLSKILEEDPSLKLEHKQETQELLLLGQGEIHLNVALDRMRNKYGLDVKARRPKVAYKEAIRKAAKQHARYKKQSGGHGQFGDVHIEIKPLPRGSGFNFEEKIVGGSVPRQYIPAVEHGVKEYLAEGPLGFPVVDVAVTLFDGQFHSVDSSENSFRSAARIAMSEGMPKCDPVLLEPIYKVELSMPSEYTSKVNSIVSGRRGQILGFDARDGWDGWDILVAMIPESEVHDLIVDLRSATLGVGTYRSEFDHLQELTGHNAEKVLQNRG
ncbi:elongation factor G [Sneathiella sp. CAU 1612]|uniref:Elongation factor G n=1 Tax=Sneathiella sedimenti TaxID=2816034 RepID=A0ABS3F577_9PROT|nr:elongation factor G [Sneathiella sedimenti]MBO0333087.1 elongation factor G [Sneathiella sedimenti]